MTQRPRIVGYAPGAFDVFHIGHLNLLRRARLACDHLIAGVVSDASAETQKGRRPVVPEHERVAIVASMQFVDDAVLEDRDDKLAMWERLHFDVVFKGSDWEGSAKWTNLEKVLGERGVRIVYLPYTDQTSSTRLRTFGLALDETVAEDDGAR